MIGDHDLGFVIVRSDEGHNYIVTPTPENFMIEQLIMERNKCLSKQHSHVYIYEQMDHSHGSSYTCSRWVYQWCPHRHLVYSPTIVALTRRDAKFPWVPVVVWLLTLYEQCGKKAQMYLHLIRFSLSDVCRTNFLMREYCTRYPILYIAHHNCQQSPIIYVTKLPLYVNYLMQIPSAKALRGKPHRYQ